MPIKLPKGFTRRKSAGNALEEIEAPPQSSFRVFERPSVDRKSVSEGNLLSKRFSESTQEDHDNIFAAPENQPKGNLRACSGRDALATFAEPARYPNSTHLGGIACGRSNFFFSAVDSPRPLRPVPPPHQSTPARNRPMTPSSNSTATPPKLLDTDLNLGQLGDDFHNMFDGVGKQETAAQQPSTRNSSVDSVRLFEHDYPFAMGLMLTQQIQYSSSPPEKPSQVNGKASRPTPISTDRSREVEPSPYSWDSQHSGEGLLNTVESPQATSTTPPPFERRKSLPLSNLPSTTNHRSLERPNAAADRGLRRSVLYASKRDSAAVEDEDARVVRQSLYSNRRSSQPLVMSDHDDSDDTPLFANVPKTTAATEDPADISIAAHAQLAAQYEERQPATTASGTKIMTPSQFEHYRQQQALRRSNSDASSKSDDSAGSDFDEEDEAEKNREAERLRRKQEAHLSVYRQQMMKVTGQETPAPSLRPELERASNSAPNLTVPSIKGGNQSSSGKSSEGGDDDEEIPLGILAAHGFPNRNRPPTRLNPSSSIPNLRASFHQPYISSAGSVAGHESGNRSSLPVFARNLPRDPYFGASLVNPSNRESLALGGGASVYGGPPATAGPPTSLPPGGLVGVIATEERARAMRRGSPNTQAMYEYQNGMSAAPIHPSGIPRPYTMMNMNPPNMPVPPAPVSATEQAQIQLSQQMSSMMQMQMQWMQQMMQMQGGQGPPPSLMPPGAFPPTMPAMRPNSMPTAASMHNTPAGYQNDQRTLSMLDPNASSRLNSPYASANLRPGTPAGQTYAPSIAPSERSNVGMASRYRPVSTAPPEAESSYHYVPKPWNDENMRSSPSMTSRPSKPPVRPMSAAGKSILTVRSPPAGPDDDDDDEGWAEMMKKRENKRNNWKLKKETSGFGDVLNAVH
ncbi:predicted protein [Aspergillus terreus NIH2624]|uniref:Uncharacterized protein n=1 Tax=Aspergillus terreus (strain NIH 2624 / FGSC A1156) TaxID=341663 RepID=Q0CPW6_ASPTN|nr:uncharacterized protein ATEG_04268 [Aspergillus terreus NIH2624]EAU34715.1 predicted protein [Aspergillus terreus NIH2624]